MKNSQIEARLNFVFQVPYTTLQHDEKKIPDVARIRKSFDDFFPSGVAYKETLGGYYVRALDSSKF